MGIKGTWVAEYDAFNPAISKLSVIWRIEDKRLQILKIVVKCLKQATVRFKTLTFIVAVAFAKEGSPVDSILKLLQDLLHSAYSSVDIG